MLAVRRIGAVNSHKLDCIFSICCDGRKLHRENGVPPRAIVAILRSGCYLVPLIDKRKMRLGVSYFRMSSGREIAASESHPMGERPACRLVLAACFLDRIRRQEWTRVVRHNDVHVLYSRDRIGVWPQDAIGHGGEAEQNFADHERASRVM